MGNDGISVADALALRNSGYNGDNGGFGGNGAWWVIILILFFAVGGWGRGGLGNNGGGGTGYGACCTPATAQGMTDAFNFSQLDNGVRGLERGLCDGFYTTNNSINAVAAAVQNCCCQTQKSISDLGYQTQAGFCQLGNQLQSCCCDVERGQDAIKYAMSQGFNQLLVAGDKNTDRIINYMTQTEMDKLRTELQSAQFQLSQLSQTSNIINQLMPVAKPAYLTCSPYAAAFGYGWQNGYNGCGCNNGCSC